MNPRKSSLENNRSIIGGNGKEKSGNISIRNEGTNSSVINAMKALKEKVKWLEQENEVLKKSLG